MPGFWLFSRQDSAFTPARVHRGGGGEDEPVVDWLRAVITRFKALLDDLLHVEYDYINTYTGKNLYFLDPDPGNIVLEDIAHGLAFNCRFGGHTKRYYSIALHSLNVSERLGKMGHGSMLQFYGLLHDAAEAYMGDVPAPIKSNLEKFREIEERILKALWNAFGVSPPSDEQWKKVKQADRKLLNYEAGKLLNHAGWPEQVDIEHDLGGSPEEDKKKFIEKFRQLKSDMPSQL